MKRFLSLSVLCLFFLSACQSTGSATETNATNDVAENTSAPSFESSRETTTISASSTLEDDTGWGFAYNSANVLDLDYSTAWCPSNEDPPPTLTLHFPEETTLGTIGMVPGFARDEKIFFKNNRLKTVEVWLDDQAEAFEELHFEDTYAMQFFDLGGESTNSITFKITETYPGSQYDDSCIAEIDLWSDWVKTKDADAAYNYYLSYKEAFALRPISVSSANIISYNDYYGLTSDDVLVECGAIDDSFVDRYHFDAGDFIFVNPQDADESIRNSEYLGAYNTEENLWLGVAGMTPVLSAQLGTGANEQDEVTIKWIQNSFFMPFKVPQLVRSVVVTPKTCDDGTLYLSDVFEQAGMGGYTVQVIYDDRLLWSGDISLAQ